MKIKPKLNTKNSGQEWPYHLITVDPMNRPRNPERLKEYRKRFADLLRPDGHVVVGGICGMLQRAVSGPIEDYSTHHNLHTLSSFAESSTGCLLELIKNEGADSGIRLEAFRLLTNGLIQTIHKFHEAIRLKDTCPNEFARFFAGQVDSWPVLFYRLGRENEAVQKFVTTQLGLAKRFPKRRTGKIGNSYEWGIAEALYDRILAYRRGEYSGDDVEVAKKLIAHPVTESDKKKWWNVAEQILIERFGKRFWELPGFNRWLTRQYSEVNEVTGLKEKFYYSLTKSGPLRRDIIHQIKKDFFRVMASPIQSE